MHFACTLYTAHVWILDNVIYITWFWGRKYDKERGFFFYINILKYIPLHILEKKTHPVVMHGKTRSDAWNRDFEFCQKLSGRC